MVVAACLVRTGRIDSLPNLRFLAATCESHLEVEVGEVCLDELAQRRRKFAEAAAAAMAEESVCREALTARPSQVGGNVSHRILSSKLRDFALEDEVFGVSWA